MTDQTVAVVSVESPWWSKINWTQAVQAVAAVLVVSTGGKINLSPQDQLTIVSAILIIGNIATVVIRTYFTSTVTKQSVTADQVIPAAVANTTPTSSK